MMAWILHQVFAKEDRVRVPRKEHYKNSLRKAGHAWKTILEQGLTGTYFITWSSHLGDKVSGVLNLKELEM